MTDNRNDLTFSPQMHQHKVSSLVLLQKSLPRDKSTDLSVRKAPSITIKFNDICLPLLKGKRFPGHKRRKKSKKDTQGSSLQSNRQDMVMRSLQRYGEYIKKSYVKISSNRSKTVNSEHVQIVAPVVDSTKFKVLRSRKVAEQRSLIKQRENLRLASRLLQLKPTQSLSRGKLKEEYRSHKYHVRLQQNSDVKPPTRQYRTERQVLSRDHQYYH